ncbi:prefoldin subunit beta [Candidatus Woesearchaeota archaeon]|nr:prefoldin subunit beta [Candidatus Woesearchaeota archaeon]
MKQLSKDAERKIAELQLAEQNLQNALLQKQRFQTELLEAENALKEIDSSEEVYKIVGNIMISKKKEDLKKELSSRKEIINIRIKSLEKEESKIKDKANTLQKEVIGEMKDE